MAFIIGETVEETEARKAIVMKAIADAFQMAEISGFQVLTKTDMNEGSLVDVNDFELF